MDVLIRLLGLTLGFHALTETIWPRVGYQLGPGVCGVCSLCGDPLQADEVALCSRCAAEIGAGD